MLILLTLVALDRWRYWHENCIRAPPVTTRLETLIDILRSRASLHLEMLAMRQQLAMVADGDRKRLSFRPSERIFWVWLYRLWPTWYRQVKSLILLKSAHEYL